MLAPFEDVDAPVPEAELDEREARRLRVPVRGLGVDPDLRLLGDPRREDGEVLRRLVDPYCRPVGDWMSRKAPSYLGAPDIRGQGSAPRVATLSPAPQPDLRLSRAGVGFLAAGCSLPFRPIRRYSVRRM
jgi:hypothetical protein